MKYIKTKDGIIEKSKVKFLANGQAEITDGHGSWRVDDLQIIKESDNLEELFDGFVYHCHWTLDHREEHKVYKTLKDLYANNYIVKSKYFIIYGAIWTDRGLIYVAKINMKGNWELL